MSGNARLLAIFFLLFLPTGLRAGTAAPSRGTSPGGVSILYIEANSGDSSGGHAALRIGSEVYHYQFGRNGRLHLERESWEAFRFFYNDLDNRDIHEARLPLPPEYEQRIWRYFTRRLLEQENRRARLRELEDDLRLLRKLARQPPCPRLRYAGLFRPEKASGGHPAELLRRKLGHRLGRDYLARLNRQLGRELSRLPPARSEPEAVVRGLRAYREKLALLTAADILENGHGLAPGTLVALPAESDPAGEKPLSPAERTFLENQAAGFRTTIIDLLQSPRPDRGYALLLATARWQALERSLAENRFLLLDTRPGHRDGEIVDALARAGSRENLVALAAAATRRLARQRQKFTSSRQPGELRWSLLENAASRTAELAACARGRTEMLIYPEIRLPDRPGPASLPRPPAAASAATLLPVIRREFEKQTAELNRQAAYNLFTRNCVTELFADLARALPPAAKTARATGGLSGQQRRFLAEVPFIPWRMFEEVKKKLQPTETIRYPSFRKRMLADLYQRENPLRVYSRECNTLTSSIYGSGGRDRFFLFFTDDTFLARPLYGAVNLTWALSQTALGLFTWPFDHGRRLTGGSRGALFSLPELLFVNLRKGSFSRLPHAPGNPDRERGCDTD